MKIKYTTNPVVTLTNAKRGLKVRRGPSWDEGYENQDEGGTGIITDIYPKKSVQDQYWATVKWDYGESLPYRIGPDRFDLNIAE